MEGWRDAGRDSEIEDGEIEGRRDGEIARQRDGEIEGHGD